MWESLHKALWDSRYGGQSHLTWLLYANEGGMEAPQWFAYKMTTKKWCSCRRGSFVFTCSGWMFVEVKIIIVVSGIPHLYVFSLQDYRYKQKQTAAWHKVTQTVGERCRLFTQYLLTSKVLASLWVLTRPQRPARSDRGICSQRVFNVRRIQYKKRYWRRPYLTSVSPKPIKV